MYVKLHVKSRIVVFDTIASLKGKSNSVFMDGTFAHQKWAYASLITTMCKSGLRVILQLKCGVHLPVHTIFVKVTTTDWNEELWSHISIFLNLYYFKIRVGIIPQLIFSKLRAAYRDRGNGKDTIQKTLYDWGLQ